MLVISLGAVAIGLRIVRSQADDRAEIAKGLVESVLLEVRSGAAAINLDVGGIEAQRFGIIG